MISNYVKKRNSSKILIVGANASALELIYQITNYIDVDENNLHFTVMSPQGKLPGLFIKDKQTTFKANSLNELSISGHEIKADMILDALKQDLDDANKNKDEAHFLLVLYAHSHPLSRGRRGPNHRPLCPGLQDTHCLWEWYKRAEKFRRGCFQGQHWIRNKSFFGDTHEAQEIRKERESHAWYDLVQTSNISSYANVMPDPDRENTFLQSVLWF